MKGLKKITCLFITLLMLIGTGNSVSASTLNESSRTTSTVKQKEFSKNEILSLEKYISVNDEGKFELDSKRAKKDGVDNQLLVGQNKHFSELNSLVETGKINVSKDLSIKVNTINPRDIQLINSENNLKSMSIAKSSHAWNCGGGSNTNVSYHWWGYSRYACDCETNRMSADFNSVAAVGAGITVIAAYFGAIPAIPPGLSSAYFWLLASRLDSNNGGRGVYIEMTWALAFDITGQ